ncbi:hypothetical protein LN042_23885 [Kitasatospora sp. RB6PN24]|uniref:hypothetical protein n=1 Tax=Kitasatospora humi TaxID=2893891 RepID=UPI001E4ACDCC|nr:hypothetical protein [Kitasatospora humi]MCC9310071.1 hypothetical protein [Kitasatospora humi]
MSFMGTWCLVPVDADTIDHYAPLLRPAIDEEAAQSSEFLQWWRTLADTKEARHQFMEAAAPGALAEHICVVYEAWNRGHDASLPPIVVTVRKRFPAAALAYAVGPERFLQIPGWLGDLVLSPEQVRQALPAIERAFAWNPQERSRAAQRLDDTLRDEGSQEDIDALLDGIPPLWRAAADAGRGVLGAHFIP